MLTYVYRAQRSSIETIFDHLARRRQRGNGRCRLVLIALFVAAPAAAQHAKTDIVTTNDGSTLYGEIVQLQFATLHLKTNVAGTLEIEWRKVTTVTSTFQYQIELTGGERHFGTLEPTGTPGNLRIVTDDGPQDVALLDVVILAPVEHGFWNRINGSINAGLTYTQANEALQYNVDFDAAYRDKKHFSTLSGSSIFNSQEDGESSEQSQLTLLVSRVAEGKYGPFAIAGVSSNASQGYDSRTIFGGGVTRLFVENSKHTVGVDFGLVKNNEDVTESTDTNSSTELLAAISYRRYKASSHSPSVVTALRIFTDVGGETSRNRADFSFTLGWKLFHDFTLNFQIQNTYDSEPPGEDASNNNFVVITGIGYTF